MDAVLLVNKPDGMTSFDVVARCRHIFHEKKSGHTGTLDPNARGLMIVLLGKYTKLTNFAVKDHKHYHAMFELGRKYDTGDIWGTVIDEKTPGEHTVEELQMYADRLTGTISQMPPMYSAIKVNGKKLYEYARKGKEVERTARTVTVDRFAISRGDLFEADCIVSSGTYIRTLIEDLGELAGEYAAMSFLERTGIEHLKLEDANTLEQLETSPVFLNPLAVIDPSWTIMDAPDPNDIYNGRTIDLETDQSRVILKDGETLLAAYEKRNDGHYHCLRGLF